MQTILNHAGKKVFEKNVAQYTPPDPLYEMYTDDKGKQKRRKRVIPPGLTAKDAKVLRSVQKRAHYLDKGFRICGVRFGYTFIIGFIPVLGDVTDAALNYFLVVKKAQQAELPRWLVQKMLLNNLISASVGVIPIIGDVILAVYKANSRNAALLEEYLRIRGSEGLGGPQGQVLTKADVANTTSAATKESKPTKTVTKPTKTVTAPAAGV